MKESVRKVAKEKREGKAVSRMIIEEIDTEAVREFIENEGH